MPTLPNMSLVTPVEGADAGVWDDRINAAFALVDAHDHTSGKGVAITTAAIGIDADLTMAGFTITNLGKISFTTITAPVSGSKNLFVNSADNELYWRTNAGVNVQLTDGSSLNTSLVGGIGGDYASVGADLDYDDANDRYTFKQQSGTWAHIAAGSHRVYAHNTTESVYVALTAATQGGGLSVSYDLRLPLTVPTERAAVVVSAAGEMGYANQFAVVHHIPGAMAVDPAASHTKTNVGFTIAASANTITYPIPLPAGYAITAFTLYCRKTTTGADTITARLAYTDDTTGGETLLGSGVSNNANNPGFVTLTETVAASINTLGRQHYLKFSPGGATAANHSVYHLEVTATRI